MLRFTMSTEMPNQVLEMASTRNSLYRSSFDLVFIILFKKLSFLFVSANHRILPFVSENFERNR